MRPSSLKSWLGHPPRMGMLGKHKIPMIMQYNKYHERQYDKVVENQHDIMAQNPYDIIQCYFFIQRGQRKKKHFCVSRTNLCHFFTTYKLSRAFPWKMSIMPLEQFVKPIEIKFISWIIHNGSAIALRNQYIVVLRIV